MKYWILQAVLSVALFFAILFHHHAPSKTIARGRYREARTITNCMLMQTNDGRQWIPVEIPIPECWTMKRIEGADTVSFCATESEWKSWPSPVTPKETK